MKIRTKLLIINVILGPSIIFMSWVIFYGNQLSATTLERQTVVDNLILDVVERNATLQVYLFENSEKNKNILIEKNNKIGEILLIAFDVFGAHGQMEDVRKIQDNYNRVTFELDKIFISIENNSSENEDTSVIDQSVYNIFIQSQSTLENARSLLMQTQAEVAVNKRIVNVFFIGFFIVSLILVFIYILFSMGVIRPIGKLTAVAKRIGGGDLTTRIQGARNDELGELANEFNNMVDRLTERELIENILRSMKDILLVVDNDGNITEVNQSALDVLGYTEKELKGKPISTVLQKRDVYK